MIPEYFKGWYVPTTCVHPIKTKWVPRPAQTAEKELRTEFGNKGILVSAYKFPVAIPEAHSESWGNLYFDFDGSDPKVAQAEAIKLLEFLTETLTLEKEDIQIYYSGNKGYHIFVNASALGVKPMASLHKVYEYIAITLAEKLTLTTLDLSIYNRVRQFRVSNSIHDKSGRYRLPLSIKTLTTKTHEEIITQADRPGLPPSEFKFVPNPHPVHVAFFQKALEAFTTKESHKPIRKVLDVPDEVWGKVVGLPVCVQDMLDRFMGSGHRFTATPRIVSYFKATGSDESEVMDILEEKIRENYPPSEASDRVTKMRSSVTQIYRGDYTFSCAFALSLTKWAKPEEKVKCSGSACPLFESCGSSRGEMDIRI